MLCKTWTFHLCPMIALAPSLESRGNTFLEHHPPIDSQPRLGWQLVVPYFATRQAVLSGQVFLESCHLKWCLHDYQAPITCASSSMLEQRKMTDREPDTTRELRTPFYKRLRIPAVGTFEIAIGNTVTDSVAHPITCSFGSTSRSYRSHLRASLGMAPTLSHHRPPEKRGPSPSVL